MFFFSPKVFNVVRFVVQIFKKDVHGALQNYKTLRKMENYAPNMCICAGYLIGAHYQAFYVIFLVNLK